MNLSVIICTHNPRPDYLRRVLDALKEQTLPKEQWELLLIDNASREPLAKNWDLSWHPGARHLREEELGLTPARLRGIRESTGENLVFVDDDNVLDPNYLGTALDLLKSRPWIGAFCGNSVGEFETEPEIWAVGMLSYVVQREAWVCLPGAAAAPYAPYGAGLVIRRSVAVDYAGKAAHDPLRLGLDRKGASLVSHGDIDMALFACARGLAIGRLPDLSLTHLIPSARLERDYLLRLTEGTAFSGVILQYLWEGHTPGQTGGLSYQCRKLFRFFKTMRNRFLGRTRAVFEDDQRRSHEKGVLQAGRFLQSPSGGAAATKGHS